MRRAIATAAIFIVAHTSLSAEVSQLAGTSSINDIRTASRGVLLNRDIMTISDMGNYSRGTSLNYGTARSMAMAGAMTSLGGDASSMFINPAGLGMAIDSDITFTPLVTMQSSDNSGGRYYDNDVTKFSISNLSTTFNIYESGTTKLVSLNFGLGYNRMADLNYGYSLHSSANASSIARLFSQQLTADQINVYDLYGNDNPDWSTLPTDLWGAALGYKTGLTDTITSDTEWGATWISDDTSIDQYVAVESSGSIGEYDIALGANVDNKLYLGFTLGIQSLYHHLDLLYGEEYSNPESFGSGLTSYDELHYMNYNQAVITRGIGVNVKLGATYRLNDSFRVGVAYHSPTKYSLRREYQGSMASCSTHYADGDKEVRYASADSPVLEDIEENEWIFRSPAKLMVGASMTLCKRALLSVDYERMWCGSMRVKSAPTGVALSQYYNIGEIYQSVNTLRIGGEYKVTPQFALRGGYSFSSSMVGDGVSSADLLDMATANKVSYYSAGVGYSPNRGISLDLTYMRQSTEYTDSTIFYSTSGGAAAQSGSYSTRLLRSNISLSLVLRM
ncbi:MAG: outer membrane protein transport protein [Rikenellaceae bacterium]